MQTTAPPDSVRANGHPLADGRKQQSQNSPKPLTSLYLAQPSTLAVHQTELQLIVLLAQSIARIERRLIGEVSENTGSVITHAIELMRELEKPSPIFRGRTASPQNKSQNL